MSSAQKAQIARDAGADHIINYKTENVANTIIEITGKEGVDRVVAPLHALRSRVKIS